MNSNFDAEQSLIVADLDDKDLEAMQDGSYLLETIYIQGKEYRVSVGMPSKGPRDNKKCIE